MFFLPLSTKYFKTSLMKRILPFFFILTIILAGCGSSKKQLQKGNYDAAIEKAVKSLRKDPKDVKQIDILTQAYTVANEQDNERVRFLKMEGRPNNWDEIYLVYKAPVSYTHLTLP